MSPHKPIDDGHRPGTRDRVLAAAERLLADGAADFSMRDLAAAASVSFATPFNHFGSKLQIMRALSTNRIEQMHQRVGADCPSSDAPTRVMHVVTIATAVMLEKPEVNRAVMAAIGAPGATAGSVLVRSRALWVEAIGDGTGLAAPHQDLGRTILPDQLAIGFRGVLSFWTAGEIGDGDLPSRACEAAATLMLGFVDAAGRRRLIDLIQQSTR